MNRQAKHRSHRQKGFTLIEVMLALALTSLLLSLLSTGVFMVAQDWNRGASALDEQLDQSLIVLQLDRALQGAFSHSYLNEKIRHRQLFFTGEDDELTWVSTVSPMRESGLTVWKLHSEGSDGVYLSLAPALTGNPQERIDGAEPTLILPGYRLRFEYLHDTTSETRKWTGDWEASELLALPLAVHAVFEPFDRDDETYELVVPIRNSQHRAIRPLMTLITAK